MIELQCVLFLLILVGIYAKKRNFITADSRQRLTDLFIGVILPCNIISSFNTRLTVEVIRSAGTVLALAFGVQFFQLFLSKFLYGRACHGKKEVVQYGTICSNSGFMGNPVVQGVYGAQGLLYASISLIPVRIFMWSAGLSLFTSTDRKNVLKVLLKHPCMVAVYIGIGLMLIQYRIPEFLVTTISDIGNCTTAISMIIIGSILADISWKNAVDKLLIYFSFVRLIGIPVIVLLGLKLLRIGPLATGVTVLLAGMPAGSTTAILAMKYGCDSEYASKAVLLTTFFSLVTLPALILLIHLIG